MNLNVILEKNKTYIWGYENKKIKSVQLVFYEHTSILRLLVSDSLLINCWKWIIVIL